MTDTKEKSVQSAEKRQTMWQAVKFTLFSISAGVVQFVSFTILNEWIIRDIGEKYGWSYFIALVLSVLWNFTFNRKFTFKSANNVPIAMLEVLAYYAVFTPLSIWWGVALERIGWNEYIILGITMIINFITEFLWSKFVVFREPIDKHAKYLAEKEKLSYQKFKNNEYFEKARAVVIKNGKVLLIKDVESGKITVPGGGVDEGETIEEAAVRETKEETGIEVKPICIVAESYYDVPMKYKGKDFISKRRETYYLCNFVSKTEEQYGLEGEYAGKTEIFFAEVDELSKTKISKNGIDKVKEIIKKEGNK